MCGTRTFSVRGCIRPRTLAEIFEHCQDQSVIAYNSQSRRITRVCSSFGARIEPRFGDRLIVINQYRSRNLALVILLPIAETRYSKTVSRANMPPASSPLRPAAPRPGATRSTPSAALRGVVSSPVREASSASSVARRTEPPSTLKCGRYPNPCEPNLGPFPCENKVYLNGADFEAFRRDDDAPVHLQVTTGAGDWVYLAQALDAVERGVLSLGFAQREETGMEVGHDVAIRRWYPSPAHSLTALRLCVSPCGWEEGPLLGRAHIDAADLVRFVRQKVAGQVFKEGQTFVVTHDPYGVGDSCILTCADTRIALDVTVERSCIVNGKPAQCVEFAGQRPWPRFGQLAEGTTVCVYQGRGTERSLNLRYNKMKLPLIVQDVAVVVVVAAAILLAMVSLAKGQLHLFLAELIETLELVAAERTCDAVGACELDCWTLVGRLAALAGRWACRPLKFALVTVFAAYVAGWVERYVLPVLRFFWQIPW